MPMHSFSKITGGKTPVRVNASDVQARELSLVGQKLKTALSDRKMISPSSALFTEGAREGAVADAVLLKRGMGPPSAVERMLTTSLQRMRFGPSTKP